MTVRPVDCLQLKIVRLCSKCIRCQRFSYKSAASIELKIRPTELGAVAKTKCPEEERCHINCMLLIFWRSVNSTLFYLHLFFMFTGANQIKTLVKILKCSSRNFRIPFGGPIQATGQIWNFFIWSPTLGGLESEGQKFLWPFFSAAAAILVTKFRQCIEDPETHKIFLYWRAHLHNFRKRKSGSDST